MFKELAKKVFALGGLELRRINPPGSLQLGSPALTPLSQFFLATRKSGFRPSLIYDIGANRGLWTREVFDVFPSSRFILFEPQRHLEGLLAEYVSSLPEAELRGKALSDRPGSVPFSVSPWDVASRIADADAVVNDSSVYLVEATTIDMQAELDGSSPDVIKIDVEGAELSVLRGARQSLRCATIVIVETAICCQATSNTAIAIIQAMASHDFVLMGIVNLNPYQTSSGRYASGIVWLADFAFVRRGTQLCSWFSSPPDEVLDSRW